MNTYLVNQYEVKNGVWTLHTSYSINGDKLADEIQSIFSRGFRCTFSNVFAKTFTFDDCVEHLAYSFVELPNL